MTPIEEAECLIESVYYKLMDTLDRQERTKDICIMFCERHIQELESEFIIQYWKDVITEIKGL